MTQAATLAQLASSGALSADTSGNVGIGTTTPSSYGNGLVVYNSGTGVVRAYGSTVGTYMYASSGGGVGAVGTETNHAFTFNTNNVERMRLDTSGNLLVGTTTANGRVSSTPKAGFSPAGSSGTWTTASAISVSGSFGGGVSWIDGSGGYCAWVDDAGTDFNIAGGLVSNSVGNGVFLNGYAATAWSARSDERLKDKFEPITDAVNKVGSLRAVTGVYKNFPEDRQAFLFAQDVQKVLPEAVSVADKKSPEQYLGLAYTQVIPLLVAAIQELKAELDVCKAEIAALKGV